MKGEDKEERGSKTSEQKKAAAEMSADTGSSRDAADECDADDGASSGSTDSQEKSANIDKWVTEHHNHTVQTDQCGSKVVAEISAPLEVVWSHIHRGYNCVDRVDIREPSAERISGFTCVRREGGGQGLPKFTSWISVHEFSVAHRPGVLVIASYVADIPDGNTKDDTEEEMNEVVGAHLTSLKREVETSMT